MCGSGIASCKSGDGLILASSSLEHESCNAHQVTYVGDVGSFPRLAAVEPRGELKSQVKRTRVKNGVYGSMQFIVASQKPTFLQNEPNKPFVFTGSRFKRDQISVQKMGLVGQY